MSDALNYHHLRYFWAVVREGGITRASERLNVSQPAISAQLRELEQNLGTRLYTRSGRTIVLTDVGRLTFQYADQIFGIGKELFEVVTGPAAPRATEIDGITINGVAIIKFADDGRIVSFKVMVRPLKAINLLHRLMGEQLAMQ